MPEQPSPHTPLPSVRTDLAPEELVAKLDTASRRGRLPGFEKSARGGLFAVAAFGEPYDKVLLAHATQADGRTELVFDLVLLKKLPAIFAVVLIATVWPGVYLTDQLIPGSWGWIPTWWWYLPLTVIPLPWVWIKLWRKSEAASDASAREAIEKIAKEIGGDVCPETADKK